MAIFDFLRKRDDTNTVTENVASTSEKTTQVDDVLLQALIKGEPITRQNAMTIPAVSSAVDFISNAIASMPVKLYKVRDKVVESRDEDNRVRLLNADTGDTLNAFELKKNLVQDYLMGRGGYAYIRRNRNDVTGLFYVMDEYVSVLINANPIFKERTLFVYDHEYELFDFIKLLRNTKDGASGVGLTTEVGKALETAYTTLLYQLGLVKTGGNKKGFLKSQRRLGQEEINTLKNAWARMYGNNSSENVVVLNNGLEFQEASNSSVEMQLDQNKKTLTNEIERIFHIDPNDPYKTFKEAIYPIVKALETELNCTLLLEKEKKNYFFEFDVKEIVRATYKERFESYKLAKETGFMTINEIRRAENMSPIDGMDVINVGLAASLYDINTHTYYTPNTGATADLEGVEKKFTEDAIYDQVKADGNIG